GGRDVRQVSRTRARPRAEGRVMRGPRTLAGGAGARCEVRDRPAAESRIPILRKPFPRLLSSCGPWVPDLRSLTLARPGHAILVSRASAASALARAERDPGPSAKSAQHVIESRARVRRAAVALAAALLLIFAAPAPAQEAANVGKLSGTLK